MPLSSTDPFLALEFIAPRYDKPRDLNFIFPVLYGEIFGIFLSGVLHWCSDNGKSDVNEIKEPRLGAQVRKNNVIEEDNTGCELNV